MQACINGHDRCHGKNGVPVKTKNTDVASSAFFVSKNWDYLHMYKVEA